MAKGFTDRWTQKEKEPSVVDKIKNIAAPEVSIKDQITSVTQRLDMQTKTLDGAVLRFQNRDAEIFNRIVKAMANHESARANILATELSEIRKVQKMLNNASLALQSVSMRLTRSRWVFSAIEPWCTEARTIVHLSGQVKNST
jgi:division protein CdvB (Snf7/Vps24/ESCRT-III family)